MPDWPSMVRAWPNRVFWTHGARSTSVKSTILPAPFVSIFLNIVYTSIGLKLLHVGYQRPELMRDANGNHGGPVGDGSRFESPLVFLFRFAGTSAQPKVLRV